jgi:hypothetical protein
MNALKKARIPAKTRLFPAWWSAGGEREAESMIAMTNPVFFERLLTRWTPFSGVGFEFPPQLIKRRFQLS